MVHWGLRRSTKAEGETILYRKECVRLYIEFFFTALFAMPFNSVIQLHKEVFDKTKYLYACLYLIKKQY